MVFLILAFLTLTLMLISPTQIYVYIYIYILVNRNFIKPAKKWNYQQYKYIYIYTKGFFGQRRSIHEILVQLRIIIFF